MKGDLLSLETAKRIAELEKENEQLKKRNKEIYDGFMATTEELCEYATRNEKAIEHIKNESWYCCKDDEEVIDRIAILKLLNILSGDDTDGSST